MADEIKLKAPTVEQQVVVNINGEDKLKSFADTLDKISNNKNLQKYWKTQQDLINATTDAYNNFQKKASKDNASELIKVTNALKAMSGTDLSHILPDFDKISKGMAEAQKVAGNIDSAFSVKGFKEAFDSFETLEAYGTDIQKLFSHFGVSSDIGELQQNVRLLESEVEKLTRKLSNARNANEELRNEFENFKVGSGFADKLDELDRLKAEMQNIRDEATQTFNQFLDVNKIDRYDWFNNDRFAEYFEKLENGTLTASEAIRQFKTEYGYLLEESFKSNGNSFGLDQLQAFSTKLDSIFQQVEETSNKINDILSNGVIAKSVQNLSEDTTLPDSQRSIFGNIFQDEEALKSVTALFQKLIDETNQAKNTEIFNTEQFTKLESLFTSIESSLSSIKGVLVDVGDGEELSPLLKTIANIESAIDNLSSSVKGIGLNMNIDFGSDTEMEAKAQAKISNALQAYQNLFEHIKMSSAGGSIITQKFFDFDINQFDTPMSKLQAYIKFIKDMREETKKMFGGQDILKIDTDNKYWNRASAAMGQVKKTFNEMKAASDTNPLENIFGKTDLTEVLNQLSAIVSKLDEISISANRFADVFKDGLNVNASVEEIEKLTNRVKELEDELAKIKAPTTVTTSQESNISSGMKNAFPSTEATASVEKTTQAIKEENSALEETANKAKQAVSELVKSRDVISQNWYRKKGTVIGKDSKGNDITRDTDEFSFIERLKNGQLQTVLATYDEETGKWAEQVINVETAFEQVEKAIISTDNKIASLEISKEKTLAAHPGYDVTADDNQIAIEREKRDELQATLNLYAKEKEYVFEIEAANKRIADNQERLNNKKQSQTNLRQTVHEATRQKSIDQTNRLLNKQQIIIDGIEKSYSKAANNDLDKAVNSQSDLTELKKKKNLIQFLLNDLKDEDRNSSNEKEFLQVEKLIAEYKQLAKDKLKANNPSKQELGGQELDVLLANQVTQYNKLISQSEKYGDVTKEITDELKAQRDLIAEQDKNGIYVARSKKADGSEITANDYYDARDNYKINKSIFNSYEDNIKNGAQSTAKQQAKSIKEEWTNAIKTVKEYESAVTKLNNLKASDKRLGTRTADIEAQQKKIDDMKSSFESAQTTLLSFFSSTDKFNSLPVSSIKEVQDAIKLIQTAANGSTESVSRLEDALRNMQETSIGKLEKTLSNYQGKVSGYAATINKFGDDGWTSPEYLGKVQEAREALRLYQEAINELKANPDLINKESLANVEKLGKDFEDITLAIKNMTAAQKGYTQLGAEKTMDKISQMLKENSKMSRKAKADIKAWYDQIKSGNPSASLDVILGKVEAIVRAEKDAGRGGKSMWDAIKEKAFYSAATAFGTYFGVNDIFRYIKEGIDITREFDTALTEMRKVSDETVQSLKNYQATTFDTADAVGTTAKQIQESTADYMRLGESLDEASESAKTANILLNVSEFDNIEDATKSLVSMGQAYKDLDKMTIVDKLNEVGNNYAISTDELATALQKSAATLSLMGNTIDEAASLVTTANATIQDADSVSAGLRTISLRLVGTEEAEKELSAMNEEVDAFVKATNSKKQQIIKDYTAVASNNYQGFDILDSNGNYKNTYEILLGIAKVYKEIQEQDKKLGTNHATALIEELAGKNRSNIASAILQDPTQLEAVKKSSEEAMGSAEKELNSYLDSIDGKMAQLENRAQEFWFKIIDSETIKNGIDLLSTLLKSTTNFVDKVGLLPTILTGIGTALSFKNVGIDTLVAY